ncbi:MAG TPA: hypothetical protein PKK31_11115 [Elusimicrobiales bacterium]|nr:hypothetical protein [Elusimicrobiales bacterium]
MEWVRYSIVLLAGSVTGFVYNALNRILVIIFLPVSAMADFDIASKPQTFIRGILSALTSAIIPVSAHYDAAGRKDKIMEILLRGTLWLNAIIFPPLIFVMVMMPELITLWLGPGHERIAPYAIAIAGYLAVFAMPAALANLILIGMGKAKLYLPVQLSVAALTLVLSVSGAKFIGLKGIVYAFVLGQILTNISCILVFIRLFKLSAAWAVKELIVPHFKLLAPAFLSAWAFAALGPPPFLYPLAGGFAACCAASYLFYYLFIMENREKEFLLSSVKGLSRGGKLGIWNIQE